MSVQVIGLIIKTSTQNVRIEMKPTRNEMLLAWMTLIKVKDHYDSLDSMDRVIILDVLKLLDKLQRMEGNER
jgi:mRNA-degrading endonuclease HigB of HigAB toxin-antitoxin module